MGSVTAARIANPYPARSGSTDTPAPRASWSRACTEGQVRTHRPRARLTAAAEHAGALASDAMTARDESGTPTGEAGSSPHPTTIDRLSLLESLVQPPAAPRADDEDSLGSVGDSNDDSPIAIFISYRINPDEPIAVALRRLIRSAITPAPNVFVSGDGGLKPSAFGYKPQIQRAVQQAKAFIGLITHESREREWIFYEAGAAWGRGQLYAPLLVGTKPSDLPSSIAEYQATNAADAEKMLGMIRAIAIAVGGQVRNHFSARYAAFQRAAFPKADEKSASDTRNEDDTPIGRAIDLLKEGKRADADKLFDEEEKNAPDDGEKGRIATLRRVFDPDLAGTALLTALNEMPKEYHESPYALFWKGLSDPRSKNAEAYLSSVAGNTAAPRWLRTGSMRALAELLARVGRANDAYSMLAPSVFAAEWDHRLEAARTLQTILPDSCGISKMLLGIHCQRAAGKKFDYTDSIQGCEEAGWTSVRLRLTTCQLEWSDDVGRIQNEMGRVYEALGLNSLAYESYSKAAQAGVTVARCNMASLLTTAPNALAALLVLDEHSGKFDAAGPDYPYRVRADAEQAVDAERRRAQAIALCGATTVEMLADLFEEYGACKDVGAVTSKYLIDEKVVDCSSPDTDGFMMHREKLAPDEKAFVLVGTRLKPFSGLFRVSGRVSGVAYVDAGGVLNGVEFEVAGEDQARCRRFTWGVAP